jgi:hypothetical protein
MDVTMRNTLHIVLVISVVLTGPMLYAQTPVTVSDPKIEIRDNIIHIHYDILHSTPEDQFVISIEITDADGNKIKARALEGDVGKDIPGGNDKHIAWDLEADKIYLNTSIYFEINATYIPQPEPAVVPQEEPKSFSRTNLIIQSLAVPGLGLSRITDKPHWIKGVAGYGCIAGSVIFNLQARNTYRSIEDYPDFEDKKTQFDLSVKQDNLSDVLGFAAIGIWVADFIWTMTGTSDMKGNPLSRNERRISVGGSLDPMTYTPTVNIRYNF